MAMMDLAAVPWVLWVVLATVILGLAIAWGQYRASKVTPHEEARTEAAVRKDHIEERIEERIEEGRNAH
jgi:hypothetical protein